MEESAEGEVGATVETQGVDKDSNSDQILGGENNTDPSAAKQLEPAQIEKTKGKKKSQKQQKTPVVMKQAENSSKVFYDGNKEIKVKMDKSADKNIIDASFGKQQEPSSQQPQ